MATFTRRETQILPLIAEGLTNKAIGAELRVSGDTAKHHVSSILAKTGCARRYDVKAWLENREGAATEPEQTGVEAATASEEDDALMQAHQKSSIGRPKHTQAKGGVPM